MLFLPLEEDSLLFRLCLYYGVLVLLVELLIPLLFHRQVRIEIPRLALHAPAVPLSTREFQHRRLALQQQMAALQRALAETPRRSPQKRRQLTRVTATKNGPAASPSSSLASPTSSVRLAGPPSLRKTSNERNENKLPLAVASVHKSRPLPMTMGDFLATRTVRRGGFSFNEVFEDKEHSEEKNEDFQKERDDWTQAVNMRKLRQREVERRPVRFVSEDGSLEPSEASTRLEARIGARRRQKASTPQSCVPPRPPSLRICLSAAPAPVAPVEKGLEHSASNEPDPVSPRQQDEEKVMDGDEERKELEQSGASSRVGYNALTRKGSEQSKPRTDFQAFCASFAAGGSAAAQRAVVKRKHHEACGVVDKQVNDRAPTLQQISDRLEHWRTLRQDVTKPNGGDTAETPHSGDKRSHDEAFGSDDKQVIENVVVTRQVLDKCKHDQAFGMTKKQEQPNEKTPQIARRISFGDEANALADTPSKEMPGRLSNGKRQRTLVFGMNDEDDEDTEWRDSLAFRPHRFRRHNDSRCEAEQSDR